MPIIKSAIKKAKQDKKRYAKNLRVKRDLREATKAFEAKPTFETLRKLQSQIDTAVKKNILERNTAARRMKKFSKAAKEAGVKIPKTAAKPIAKPATKTATKAAAKVAKPAAKSAAKAKTVTKKPVAKKPAAKK